MKEKGDVRQLNLNKKILLRERKRHTARKRAQDADPPFID